MPAESQTSSGPFDYLNVQETPLPYVGFKVLRILGHQRPLLISQNNFGEIWQPGLNLGVCAPSGAGTVPHAPEDTPVRECMCGFHVWASLDLAVAHQEAHNAFDAGPSLIAIVMGVGNIELHHGEGWRSQYAQLVGLISDDPIRETRELAKYYQVPLVLSESATQQALEFGELMPADPEEPDYLSWEVCQRLGHALGKFYIRQKNPAGDHRFGRSDILAHASVLDLLLYTASLKIDGTISDVIAWANQSDGGLATVGQILGELVKTQNTYSPIYSQVVALAPNLLPDPEELAKNHSFALSLQCLWADPTTSTSRDAIIDFTRAALSSVPPNQLRPLSAIEAFLQSQHAPVPLTHTLLPRTSTGSPIFSNGLSQKIVARTPISHPSLDAPHPETSAGQPAPSLTPLPLTPGLVTVIAHPRETLPLVTAAAPRLRPFEILVGVLTTIYFFGFLYILLTHFNL